MKIFAIFFLFLALSACDKKKESPQEKISLHGMTREVALAYSKSPNLNKIPYDKLWLENGEVFNISSGFINPDKKSVVHMFDEKGREELIKRNSGFEIYVDREHGKICTHSECAAIFYACRRNEFQDVCNYYR